MRRILCFCLGLVFSANSAAGAAPWFSSDWTYRVPITVVSSLIEGTTPFPDFALLVNLDGVRNPDVFASAKTDGSDLLFTAGDGATALEREIVSYDAIAQKAEIWVRVGSLSKNANQLYIYYGNPAANLDPTPLAAWSNEYRAVYHFEDDPVGGVLTDSSPQGSNAALFASSAWESSDVESGAIGQGWRFNGSTHHIATKNVSTQDQSYSVSAWLAHTTASTDFFFQAQPDFWHLAKYSGESGIAAYATAALTLRWNPITPINVGYHHFLWSFDAINDTIKFYYDGVPQTFRGASPAPPHYTGRLVNPGKSDWVGIVGPMYAIVSDYHDGGADEFRLREGVSAPERILTEFRSQSDNSEFLYFSIEQTYGDTPVGIADGSTLLRLRSFPNPSPGLSSIRYTLPEEGPVRLVVYNVAGREVVTLVDRRMPAGTWTDRWNGRNNEGRQMAAGVYFLRLQTPLGTKSVKVTLVR